MVDGFRNPDPCLVLQSVAHMSQHSLFRQQMGVQSFPYYFSTESSHAGIFENGVPLDGRTRGFVTYESGVAFILRFMVDTDVSHDAFLCTISSTSGVNFERELQAIPSRVACLHMFGGRYDSG